MPGPPHPVRSLPIPKRTRTRCLRKFGLCVLAYCCSWFALGCAPLANPGPLRVRNQHPIQLTGYQPLPRAARPIREQAQVRGDLAISNMWLPAANPQDRVDFDFETLRFEAETRFRLGTHFDLEASIPLLYSSSGSMDRLIESFHRETGTDQQGRTGFARGRYRAVILGPDDMTEVYRLEEDNVAWGDLPVTLNWFPTAGSDSPIGWGFRAGIELPTGDENEGAGNGGVDYGGGLLLDCVLTELGIYSWYTASHFERTSQMRRTGLSDSVLQTAGIAGEVGLHPQLSLVTQFQWENSILRDFDARHAEKDQMFFWLGTRWQITPRTRLEFSLAEDLVTRISSDIQFQLSLTVGL